MAFVVTPLSLPNTIQEPQLDSRPELPKWASWTWPHQYLPNEIHLSADSFQVALSQLKDFPWKSRNYGTPVVLGLGLLIRDCWRVQELEEPEDGKVRAAPSYLYSSLLGVGKSEAILAEVEVINARLDQELPGGGGPGKDATGDEVHKQIESEEERKKQDEVRQKAEEAKQRDEETRRKEAAKKQEEEARKQRDEEAKRVAEEELKLAQKKKEKKGKEKGTKRKEPAPSNAGPSNPTEVDNLEPEDQPGPTKRNRISRTNKKSPAKNTRSSGRKRNPTQKLRGSL